MACTARGCRIKSTGALRMTGIRLLPLIAGTLISLQLHQPVHAAASPWQQALDLGDYTNALAAIAPLATSGNASAQFALGNLYYHGHGVPQNYATAAKWLEQAARQNHLRAQSLLGLLYARGLGVKKDYAIAEELLARAAELGDLEAQAGLALLYASVDPDHGDKIRAHMWWSIASLRGYANAGASRDRLQQDMTPVQISIAQTLALECTARNYRQCRQQPNAAETSQLKAEQEKIDNVSQRPDWPRQQYASAILEKVTRNWQRPPGSDDMPACKVQVTQAPGGIVLDVKFLDCNYSSAKYRVSIESAIYRAEPLPQPGDPALFEPDLIMVFVPD